MQKKITCHGEKHNLSTVAISRDTFSQKLEDNTMENLLITNKATGYFKYVEGILTVMGNNITTTEELHSKFISICAIESFTIEGECNKKANFLDIKTAFSLLKPNGYVMHQQI